MVSQRERERERECHKMLRSGHCHGFTKRERECYKMLRSGHCHGFTKRERVSQNAEVWTLSWFHKERERECYKMLRSGHCHCFTKRESVSQNAEGTKEKRVVLGHDGRQQGVKVDRMRLQGRFVP